MRQASLLKGSIVTWRRVLLFGPNFGVFFLGLGLLASILFPRLSLNLTLKWWFPVLRSDIPRSYLFNPLLKRFCSCWIIRIGVCQLSMSIVRPTDVQIVWQGVIMDHSGGCSSRLRTACF